jgi:hypothetical protein
MKRSLALFLIFETASVFAQGGTITDVCQKLRSEKKPTAYLIDSTNAIHRGPIDIGTVLVSATFQGAKEMDTGFRLLVVPATLQKHEEISGAFSAKLVKTKSLCPKSTTYKVALEWFFNGNEVRPYKFTDELTWFTQSDKSGYENVIEGLYRNFDPTVIGVLVDNITH